MKFIRYMLKSSLFLCSLLLIFSVTELAASNYSRGMSKYMRRNYDEARELLNKALEEDPSNGNAYYYLGEIEKNTKNYPAAIEYYLKALDNRLNGKYVKLTYWNLIILTEQRNDQNGMVKTCKAFYRKTGDPGAKQKVDSLINKMLWTNDTEAINEYNQGKSALQGGKTAEAEEFFTSALRKDSSFLAPRFELGMIAHRRGEADNALRHLHVIADRIPFYTSVQQLTADMYMAHRSWSNARKYYSNVIEYGFISKETQRSTLIRRAQCYFQLRRYSQAEDDIKQALAIRDSSKPKLILSAVYIKQKKYDDALVILKELKGIYPSNPDIDYQIGSIYYKKHDDQYTAYFKSVYSKTKSHRNLPDKYLKVYLILAGTAFTNEQYSQAASIYGSIDTGKLPYKKQIEAATSFYNAGRYSSARDILSTVVLTDRDKILLSRTYIKTGEQANAKAVMRPLVLSSSYRNTILQDPVLQGTAQAIIDEENRRREEELRMREEEIRQNQENSENQTTQENTGE